jgi:hypothetical protein
MNEVTEHKLSEYVRSKNLILVNTIFSKPRWELEEEEKKSITK